jgi:hypothetical protein|tara:strand:+ start:127 stop:327 length:201 start_codon:yes stop_codon:yes gene_type:complete
MWHDLTVAENAARNERMNYLYDLDNRSDSSHPHANTFTGLQVEVETYERFKKEKAIYEKWDKRFNK